MALEKSGVTEETRKIDFHIASNNQKQCNGFGNGFKLLTLNPDNTNKQSGSDHFDTGFDPDISFKITYKRIGAGLRNLGNTCFLNSVLQCLTYTEPLAAYLQSGKHQNSCHTAGFCALCAIQKHVSRALQSTGRILEPKDLVSNLRRISRNFRNARQEDAHEYMVNLLESMHKCCLPSGVPSESPNAYEKSLVHKIFGGRLRSQVKCMQCSYCSNKFDPFLDLSLEIYKADSLYKALAHFTAKEQLDGGAKQYQCQQCNQKVKALKQLTIYTPPNVLTIHLKRFGSHVAGQKINKTVSFGSNLDLKHFVSGPYDGDLKYTLYGVLVHAGWSTRSGHYYCFVRTSTGMWYTLDDNQVYQVTEKKVLAQKAYMLFYVRDRGNICAKKPVSVNRKDDMVQNANGTAVQAKLNSELIGKAKNGLVDKILDSSSSTMNEKDAPVVTPSKAIHLESSNGNVAVVCPVIKLEMQSEHHLEDCFTAATNSVLHEAESSSGIEASEASPKIEHDATMVVCDNRLIGAQDKIIDNCSKNQVESADNPPSIGAEDKNIDNCSKNQVKSADNPPSIGAQDKNIDNCNKNQVESTDNPPSIGAQDKNIDNCSKNQVESADNPPSSSDVCTVSGVVSIGGSNSAVSIGGSNSALCDVKAVHAGIIGEAIYNDECIHSLAKRRIEEFQVGIFPRNNNSNGNVSMHLLPDKTTTTEKHSRAVTKTNKPKLKLKRKLFMYQISSMPLSSSIIFGAAFAMQKKHKRRKFHSQQNKSRNAKPKIKTLEKVKLGSCDDGNCIRERNNASGIAIISSHVNDNEQRDGLMSSYDDDKTTVMHNTNYSGIISSGVRDNEQRQKLKMDITAVLCETPQSTRESRQTSMFNVLTRGLEEKTVARWDDIEVSHSEKTGVGRVENAHIIGYVGDEWDEEYDRGKRKKIKTSKTSFGRENLFQKNASRIDAKRKRAKLH